MGTSSHKPPSSQGSSSRIDDVKKIFTNQDIQKENWDKASTRHEERIN